jgi:glycosyltransferase involved in cell wall biosynthesis
MYDYVIVTHIPVFYKVNLYNEINKNKKIFVVFVASETVNKRSDDFLTLKEAKFPCEVLSEVEFENRDRLKNLLKLQKFLSKVTFKSIIVSGWDLLEFWYIIFTSSKSKNMLALESTINESRLDGIKGILKKIFLNRTSAVFASGKLHKELLGALNYNKKINVTKGVGVIRKPPVINNKILKIKNRVVYVGRLSSEKNLSAVITAINNYPLINLDVYGSGPIEEQLKYIANANVHFHGAIPNTRLSQIFNDADFLVLPSQSEPWGLVIEEALYFGLPVLISPNCGASELIFNGLNGYVIDFNNSQEISDFFEHYPERCISYNCHYFAEYINAKDAHQVGSY